MLKETPDVPLILIHPRSMLMALMASMIQPHSALPRFF